jgi:dienelactone hydrolase
VQYPRCAALLLFVCIVLGAPVANAWSQPQPQACPGDDQLPLVTFPSSDGQFQLHGALFVPAGSGPFPAVLWNHGSERCPENYLAGLALPFVRMGYVFFAPFREGQANSPGVWIQQATLNPPSGTLSADYVVHLLQAEVHNDIQAGLVYLQAQPLVDSTRISIMGGSFGGIETIFAAASVPGFIGAVDCAGAAESWSNPALRAALLDAVSNITIPVDLIQAQNDYDLRPSMALGAQFSALGKPYAVKIYPPYGEGARGQSGHNFCFIGATGWASDALNFLTAAP